MRVRGVQVHGRARAEAGAPNRVALNLAGAEVADVARGDTAVPEGLLQPVNVVDAEVEVLAGAGRLRHRQRVRVHAFASESVATVLLYDGGGGNAAMVRLRLAKPMVLVPGDRFVLRQPSPAVTLGGGVVLDAHPLVRQRKAATATWLEALRGAASPGEAARLRVERRGVAGLPMAQLVGETGWTPEAVRRWVKPMLASGALVAGGGTELLIDRGAVKEAEDRVLRELRRVAAGTLRTAELRSKAGLGDAVFPLVLGRLGADRRVEVRGDLASLPGLTPEKTGVAAPGGRIAKVEEMYRSAGLASPIVSEAAERMGVGPAELRTAITALLRTGTLVRLGSDALLVHREALARLTTELRAKQGGRSFDVAWFKSFTGLTRKHAIPLLEYLDGARVTRNVGGVRVVL